MIFVKLKIRTMLIKFKIKLNLKLNNQTVTKDIRKKYFYKKNDHVFLLSCLNCKTVPF